MAETQSQRDNFGTRLGDTGWEVEWCSHIPERYPGEADHDRAVYHTRDFRNEDEAWAFAREIYPQDQFGCVTITRFVILPLSEEWPYGHYREYIGDSESYDGDD